MIDMKELYWAAGFLEGEGCFSCHVRPPKGAVWTVTANQVQKQPLDRLAEIFLGKVRLTHQRGERRSLWQPIYIWAVYGARARGVMMTLFSLLSPRRQKTISRALLNPWLPRPELRKFCPRGHAYNEANTSHRGGKRHCKACARDRYYAARINVNAPVVT